MLNKMMSEPESKEVSTVRCLLSWVFLSQQCSDKRHYTRVPEFTHRFYLDCLLMVQQKERMFAHLVWVCASVGLQALEHSRAAVVIRAGESESPVRWLGSVLLRRRRRSCRWALEERQNGKRRGCFKDGRLDYKLGVRSREDS